MASPNPLLRSSVRACFVPFAARVGLGLAKAADIMEAF